MGSGEIFKMKVTVGLLGARSAVTSSQVARRFMSKVMECIRLAQLTAPWVMGPGDVDFVHT